MKKSSIIAGVIVTIATALSLKPNLVYAADGIPAITAGTSGLPRMDVVDVSSNNGNISVASFQKMHQYGVGAVIVKLTEATSYRNPYAATQIANAKAAGLKIGAYHYSWYTSQSSAQSEAKYFTDYAKSLKLPSDTLMVDDLEDTYTMTNNVTNNAKAFNTQVKATGFSNTSTYTGLYYKNTTGLNFSYIGNDRAWIAQYPFAPSSNSLWNTTYGMWQWNSNTSFPGVSGTFDVSIDYTNLITQVAKYKVGDTLQISSGAVKESNGYNLIPHRNWIGKITAVKAINRVSYSNFEYTINYGDDTQNVHVLEQDLEKPVSSKFQLGQQIQITDWAESSVTGDSIVENRGNIGVVKSISFKNQSVSHYQYQIDYGSGISKNLILEQDLQIPKTKFTIGSQIQIKRSAVSESNGTSLIDHRDWIGKIERITLGNSHNPNYTYYVSYNNGASNWYVREQDLSIVTDPQYKIGQIVQIVPEAEKETNGFQLSNHRGWVGIIKKITVNNNAKEHYEYWVDYNDGTANWHVDGDDLKTAEKPQFFSGQKVQIKNSAYHESNGFSLLNHRNWVGTVKSIAVKNQFGTHYEYWIDYNDGTTNWHVVGNDLQLAPEPKYSLNQLVRIVNTANVETNGTNLVPHRGWQGFIKEIRIKNAWNSHYSYKVQYFNGSSNWYIVEQDIIDK